MSKYYVSYMCEEENNNCCYARHTIINRKEIKITEKYLSLIATELEGQMDCLKVTIMGIIKLEE